MRALEGPGTECLSISRTRPGEKAHMGGGAQSHGLGWEKAEGIGKRVLADLPDRKGILQNTWGDRAAKYDEK